MSTRAKGRVKLAQAKGRDESIWLKVEST